MRYKKPSYVVDEIFNFKMELEAFPEVDADDIYLECELMHSPISYNSSEDKDDENGYEKVL